MLTRARVRANPIASEPGSSDLPHAPNAGLSEDWNSGDFVFDSPPTPEAPPAATKTNSRRATVEEVEDEGDDNLRDRFTSAYPEPAGIPLSFQKSPTSFEEMHAAQRGEYGPFDDEDDWELGKFLMQNLGVNKTKEFLKLGKVSQLIRL